MELFHLPGQLSVTTTVASPIRFILDGEVVEVDDVAPTTSVLSFLRQRLGRMGTKEGCAEGDCGACTVVVGELKHGRLQMKAINACIQFLPTLDGKALFTVESLRARDGALHPVQEAMVECHGSQCGFCTPGFVMSLWGLYVNCDVNESSTPADETSVRKSITGNLCRCTGYRPIVDAGRRMFELPAVRFDRNALATALKGLARPAALEYQFRGQRFFAPRTLADLIACRAELPSSTILAGGTDVGLWVNKQFRDLGDIIYTGEVAELLAISEDANHLTIGAAVSLADAQRALNGPYPEMNEMWERFASTPIRNAGTLGGNIANGSPIGDAMPALITLGAEVSLCNVGGTRRLPLEEIYIGYQQKALQPDEVIAFVHVPKPSPGQRFRTYKLSKRFDSDISAVCAAFAIELAGQTVASCRIAYGGMAAKPKRAVQAELALIGRKWDEAAARSAMAALARDYTPLTDMRASGGYRLKAAQNLLLRFFLETRPEKPMPVGELSVFA
ncbi:MAG: xanthine dehydrogenase small subunit [Betaproteobacteria bacterium]